MQRNCVRLFFVGLAGLAWSVAFDASAQAPTAASPVVAEERVARLVRDLGSPRYEVRVEADRALAELGSAARPVLETAYRSGDPEVRLRAGELLRHLKIDDLMAPARATLSTDKTSSAKLFAALAEQTGNHVLLGDQYGGFHDQEVTLSQGAGTFWPLVDELCRLGKYRVRAHYDTRQPGLVVVDGGATSCPTAYVGPVRAQLVSAQRNFNEQLDYEDLGTERAHTFQLNLVLMWEDRFRLVAYRSQPELVSAKTDAGIELATSQSSTGGWNVASHGTRQVSTNLRLQPPSTCSKQLDAMRLRWGIIAVGDMATLEIANLADRKTHYQDDVELVLEQVQAGPAGRVEVTLLVRRDVELVEPRDMIFQENDFDLLDAAGRAFRRQGQTNTLTDDGARCKLLFQAESAEVEPAKLRISYPRLRVHRDLEIVFRDVPLPTGRPE